jgi:very-short-patch-repair endonuclease
MSAVVRALAERQYGVVARWQLLGLGLSSATISSYVETGWLIPIHAGVYALGHRVLTLRGHLLAAVLACGPTALLSHKSAGGLWNLLATAQTSTDVTIPGTSHKPQPGIRVHRARHLHPEDIATVDDIPITSVARTVVDLGGVLRPQQRLEVIEQADRLEILDFAALQRAIDRRPMVRGAAHLRRIIDEYTEAPNTRSRLERDFLALITKAGLPTPQLNTEVAGMTVDAYWPEWRLVVELDSRAYHLNPRQFETDRIRDAKLQRLRLRSLRITERRMKTAPGQVLDDILTLSRLAS